MKIAVPKEIRDGETRLAASPDTVKKLVGMGVEVCVEADAGIDAAITDSAFAEVGAAIAESAKAAYEGADIVLKVLRPTAEEVAMIPNGALLVGLLQPLQHRDEAAAYAEAGIRAFAMELIPRISRAQGMDVLSSQSSLAGYKAVIDAAEAFGKALPMMMTAAGTIAPAKVLVLGAGVAGLQAIATARRLGAVVSAFDVRPVVKEQVQSLGARFIEVADDEAEDAETSGGYAKEMSAAYQQKQRDLIHETLKTQDIAICTALIPGRPAPELISEAMVRDMKPGSVIVDLAVETGGNCPLSEFDKIVVKHGVTLIGHANMPGRVPVDATAMYARNLLNFLTPMIDAESGQLAIDWDDEIVVGALLTRDSAIVHPALKDGDAS
ncbi:MAG: Re/Si-specific NAD(P)(+) transhydrogenase subunit alpha [Alphaproteobacteria bacterium]|jgi:NAD(P) transhydrogenase subunit alpha|nr:Re/Si-specific NAD(P)(+) transhydrogenase subunit alpha [Alphaproteobacteria bacterium]MDP6516433.1 Re/Si-specific NAD(P)(+) transhydrogenase subunit alpha [Alphaproteobacteria bacterium]